MAPPFLPVLLIGTSSTAGSAVKSALQASSSDPSSSFLYQLSPRSSTSSSSSLDSSSSSSSSSSPPPSLSQSSSLPSPVLVEGSIEDPLSLLGALRSTNAKSVILSLSLSSPAAEQAAVRNVVNAILTANPSIFLVYASSATGPGAGVTSSNPRIANKLACEAIISSSGLENWVAMRPVSFYEDAVSISLATLGDAVTVLPSASTPVQYVAASDFGRAVLAVLKYPAGYAGCSINVATGAYTGEDLAAALTSVTGVTCEARRVAPLWAVWLSNRAAWQDAKFLEGGGFGADLQESREMLGGEFVDAGEID